MTILSAETFATHAKAINHLKNAGFVFIGAPDRWQQIGETRTAYARIIVIPRTFQIRFAPSKTT
jgi:hypothetical protein